MGAKDDDLFPGDFVIHIGPGIYARETEGQIYDYSICARATRLVELTEDHVTIEYVHNGERRILPREAFGAWRLATPAQIEATRREADAFRRMCEGRRPYDPPVQSEPVPPAKPPVVGFQADFLRDLKDPALRPPWEKA